MHEVKLSLADETLLALKLPPDNVATELRLLAAVKLFELGRLSSGAAATLAGIPKPVFLMKLADYGVDTFRMTEEELLEDFEQTSQTAWHFLTMGTPVDMQS